MHPKYNLINPARQQENRTRAQNDAQIFCKKPDYPHRYSEQIRQADQDERKDAVPYHIQYEQAFLFGPFLPFLYRNERINRQRKNQQISKIIKQVIRYVRIP